MTPKTPSDPISSWRRSGPAADSGAAAQIQRADRGDHPQPADHVVEPAVAGRVLAGRPRRREAADGGEFEALREVPEREAAFAEQAFGVRAGDAGTEHGDAGHFVEGDELVEAPQVQRHHRAELAAGGIEAADDVGATAERDDGDAVLGAVAQDRRDVVVGRRASGPRRARPGHRCPCGAAGRGWTCRRRAASRSRSAVRSTRRRRSRPARRGRPVTAPTGAACTWSGRVRLLPNRPVPRPASATTGSRRRAVWPRRDPPTRSISSAEGVRQMRHALQYYTCCQSVTQLRTPASGSLRQRPAVWSISAWTG